VFDYSFNAASWNNEFIFLLPPLDLIILSYSLQFNKDVIAWTYVISLKSLLNVLDSITFPLIFESKSCYLFSFCTILASLWKSKLMYLWVFNLLLLFELDSSSDKLSIDGLSLRYDLILVARVSLLLMALELDLLDLLECSLDQDDSLLIFKLRFG